MQIRVLQRIIQSPHIIFVYLGNIGLFDFLPDSLYIKLRYYGFFGKRINIKKPITFNEKLQWLKLNDKRPEYTQMVDKISSKEYVKKIIGEQYIIPTIGIWDEFDQINFSELPTSFVLKTSHDSGGVVVVTEKDSINIDHVRKKINNSLKRNYYKVGREWPYKNVCRKILAEKYIGTNVQDYKIFCFNGEPKMTLVCTNRFAETGLKEDFFDNDWNHLEIKRPNHDNYDGEIKKPEHFSMMLKLAEKLARELPFVRIDFYEINRKIYFGEITLFPANGFVGFEPEEWDMKMGNWIQLPKMR